MPGDLSGHHFTRPKGPVQCESMLASAYSPSMKPGDLAGYRITRPKCEIYACHCLALWHGCQVTQC